LKLSRLILAGLVGFFTLFSPSTLARHWSSYGPWFVRIVGWMARRIAPSQHVIATGTTLSTPWADVHVNPGCAGLTGIRIFSILFGMILILNWRRMARPLFCVLYASAILLLWLHNAARVTATVILGGETHYGTTGVIIVGLAGGLALLAMLSTRIPEKI